MRHLRVEFIKVELELVLAGRLEARKAARFVLGVANQDLFVGIDHALSAASKVRAAFSANSQKFVDAVGDSQKGRDRTKGLASVVQIKPRGDDFLFLAH